MRQEIDSSLDAIIGRMLIEQKTKTGQCRPRSGNSHVSMQDAEHVKKFELEINWLTQGLVLRYHHVICHNCLHETQETDGIFLKQKSTIMHTTRWIRIGEEGLEAYHEQPRSTLCVSTKSIDFCSQCFGEKHA